MDHLVGDGIDENSYAYVGEGGMALSGLSAQYFCQLEIALKIRSTE
jgi:hypothetical protein